MTTDAFAELAGDFQAEYGVSKPTAEHMVSIFVKITAAYPKEQAQAQAEFNKAITAALEAGAGWAREAAAGVVRSKYPLAPAIYAEATAKGVDPAAALQIAYNLPADSATQLAGYTATQPR